MKIKLLFDTTDEFAVFILSASSIKFDLEFKRTKTDLPRLDFIHSLSEVEVAGVTYSVEYLENREPKPKDVKFMIRNYMLNDVQIENDFVYIETDGQKETIDGSQKVREHLNKKLPNCFLLSVGWRTDWSDYVFRNKNTLAV